MPAPGAREDPDMRFARSVECVDGHWLWTGGLDQDGYGIFWDGDRRVTVRAHRWSYQRYVGPIPRGRLVDHRCRIRRCVRPMCLEPVTPRENQIRGNTFGARNAARTVCENGHEFTPENTATRARPGGGRICRACQRAAVQRYRKRKG